MKLNNPLPKHRLGKKGEFILSNYNAARPWASFFPGIAGLWGIPLWVFYVNRGQCIASFGIRSKDEAIMEFLPANKAYQLVSTQGFRTFIKIKGRKNNIYYEPFSVSAGISYPAIKNKMVVQPFDLKIVETNPHLGLEVEVSYFSISGAPFAALAREVTLRNISKRPMDVEFLDGLSVLVPYGVNNFFLKEMSRTIEAWMTVERSPEGIPVFKLSTDPRDSAQVAFIKGANFYMGFGQGQRAGSTNAIVDPRLIFGEATDFSYPLKFLKSRSFVYSKFKAARNKTPCAFSYAQAKLGPQAQKKLFSLVGHVFDVGEIKKYGLGSIDENFISEKRAQNQELIEGILDRSFTSSGSESFDFYARQTYLDNTLRGGLPYSVSVDGIKKSLYVFSRKHGDLERDYNRFLIAPTYFSEGEGNYRDINQNRRCDVFFNTLVGEENLTQFINLLQLDGYNPLVLKGERFLVPDEVFKKSNLAKNIHEKDLKKLEHILSKPFVLGDLLRYIEENRVVIFCSLEVFVKEILRVAGSVEEAAYTEGYWSDHWTYNTDLLESFRSIYPDRLKWLLFEKNDFTYFDTHAFVKPRSQRYVIQHGEVRQYHSIIQDDEKNLLISRRHSEKNKVRSQYGDGAVLKTTLFDKLICLIANKTATLDANGVGIEMEADKPNWFDALNGLPGLLGSSASETFELKRLILFLKKCFQELKVSGTFGASILSEVDEFLKALVVLLKDGSGDHDFWDKANTLKESFRLKVRRGVSGEFKNIQISEVTEFFNLVLHKVDAGIAKSYDKKNGYYYTYFVNRVIKHESAQGANGKSVVMPLEFQQTKLPLFLEGFVHALRTEGSQAGDIYRAVRNSPLWDKKLKMYRVNASLDKESFELGRVKAFSPGWLENESIWLHMEYKYLLEFLKNNLFDEFYEDFFKILIPFQKPQVYGRSILENSSFIVSSAHPDPTLHGAGFVARLSGSTAEFIHMWLLMNIGPEPFFIDGSGNLALRFRPALSSKLFSKKACRKNYIDASGKSVEVSLSANTYSFVFLSQTMVTYINPKKKDTFGRGGVSPKRLSLFDKNGLIKEIESAIVREPSYVELIRSGKVEKIEVSLG